MGKRSEPEMLVALNHTDDEDNVMSLYSLKDNSWRELPRFPKSRTSQKGIPGDCQCVSLDGKLYVLGGVKEYSSDGEDDDDSEDTGDADDSDDEGEPAKKKKKTMGTDNGDGDDECSDVYVLDLAGHMEWERCASMPQPRSSFGCGVVNGKIYVFGGITSGSKVTRESLVYDPKKNAWSSIKPMKFSRSNHHVAVVGEELFVHGGERHRLPGLLKEGKDPFGTEVYHAGKNEWRTLRPFGVHVSETLFTAQGKLHLISSDGIYGHDIDSHGKYSWTLKHSFSFGEEEDSEESDELEVCAIEAVNDELLALLSWSDARESQTVLYHSKGFGSDKKEMLWDLISCELLASHQFSHILCPVKR